MMQEWVFTIVMRSEYSNSFSSGDGLGSEACLVCVHYSLVIFSISWCTRTWIWFRVSVEMWSVRLNSWFEMDGDICFRVEQLKVFVNLSRHIQLESWWESIIRDDSKQTSKSTWGKRFVWRVVFVKNQTRYTTILILHVFPRRNTRTKR